MSSVPNLNHSFYRIRLDTGGVDATPTWAAAENTAIGVAVETTFRIRFHINNTGAAAAAGPFVLRVSKNGGAYTAVTTSTGATLGAQSESTASSDADETALTVRQITGFGGTFANGKYDETGSATLGLNFGIVTEAEYGLILKTAGAVPGDTFDFRVYNSTTAFTTYTQTPRIIARQTGTDFNQTTSPYQYIGAYNDYNAAGRSSAVATIIAGLGGSAAGDLILVYYATDNATTTDSDASVVTSITDSKGNTYSKAQDWQFGSPGVQAGTSVGLWYSNSTAALVAGTDTVTLNLSSSADRDAFVAHVANVSMTAGKAAAIEAINTSASALSAAAAPSLNATTSSIECLRVRVLGIERNTAYGLSTAHTSNWTAMGEGAANSGTAATSQAVSAEFRISTGTGAASAPSGTATADQASVYVAFRADTAFSGHVLLANDVSSASNVTQPAIQQVHNPLANDVKSNSSVTQPVLGIRRDCLANDVVSASSVSNPALVQIVPAIALLANDVISASSVSQPAATILRGLLANDVVSTSSVGQPAVKALHGLLANDVKSNSSVSQPAAVIRRDVLANDVVSASSVGQPAVKQSHGLLANDVLSTSSVGNPIVGILGVIDARDLVSASSVSQPALKSLHGLLANDVVSTSSVGRPAAVVGRVLLANDVLSPSSVSQPTLVHVVGSSALNANDVLSASTVTTPAAHQAQVFNAVDVASASSVSTPLFGEIAVGSLLADNVVSYPFVSQPGLHTVQALLAENVVSGSSVSQPMVDRPGVVVPPGTELGGGGPGYGRGYGRKRWEELLRRLEEERQAALRRAQAFPSNKDRQRARKAARAASEAIAAALQAADEAAEVAHAGAIARSLEAATEAKNIAAYLAAMRAAREAAIEMELDDDDEAILMMVA